MVTQQVNLDQILEFTIQMAREAGDMIVTGQNKRFSSNAVFETTKTNTVDLVTEVDKAVEAFILQKIQATYPTHKFVGEETYQGESITDEPTWIVDPIDGTTNFIHGYPFVATSIGLAVGGVPVVGVVYNPFLDLMYSAAKGRGAFLNQKTRLPITGSPRPLADLGQALISVDIGNSRSPTELAARLNTFKALASGPGEGGKMVHSLRCIGCASLNLCQVASGGQDIQWEIGGWPWDVCAGMCILTEAGGMAFGEKGSSLDGKIDAALLASRKFLFVRAILSHNGETNYQIQRRFAEEFYNTADKIDL